MKRFFVYGGIVAGVCCIVFSARAFFPFGGRILQMYPCSVGDVPALWISVGPPRSTAAFIFPPPVTQWHLFYNFTTGTTVLGNQVEKTVVGQCEVPYPPFVIDLPGLVVSTIGTSVK